MKLASQVAPVYRGVNTSAYLHDQIQPSQCSCKGKLWKCVVNWNRCPEDYPYASCSKGLGNILNCDCECCNDAGECIGPYK